MFFMMPFLMTSRPWAVAPAYVSKGPISTHDNDTEVEFPASVALNAVALLVAFGDGDPDVGWSADGDWTELARGYSSDGDFGAVLWLKVCDGTEGGTTIAASSGGSAFDFGAQIFTFSDADNNAAEDASAKIIDNSTSLTSNATTTTGLNRLGVRLYVQQGNSASTPPAEWTERAEDLAGSMRVALDTKTIATATTEAATTRTVPSARSAIVFDLALVPR
jgi:hypothetical protein